MVGGIVVGGFKKLVLKKPGVVFDEKFERKVMVSKTFQNSFWPPSLLDMVT